ncbi:hypothetical protein [Mesorhizobium sp. BR-1-1-10]|uniref:hypothetical protein n=1 Tax=Mesorhizobium sp. BR-1-1-10 TaxID=2876660 RepID=UPI001CD104EA|nr:hypothetical protein [Mesorhizobium sp. BR-1-1-10]MBZ9975512.1 hypothetical protein [Mesorhizobium sp. BR-1-1-10]
MNHSFNIDVAGEIGVEAAIIFENILYWVVKNTANQENVREGVAWVYNSRAAWSELFPYLGEKQIRNALERLLGANLIARDNFSFGSMNRTYWYTLAERAKPYWPKGPNLGSGQKGQTKTVIDNPINETPSVSPKPTKASTRASSKIRLGQFLEPSAGIPPAEWGEWANQQLGWDTARISAEWDDFSDYWTSGNAVGGGLKADWPATWRSHCRRNAKHSGRSGGAGGAAGGGLTAALGAVVAHRHGTRPTDGGEHGAAAAGATGTDAGVARDSNGRRVIPY